MGFCRMHLVYYNYRNSGRLTMLQVCNPCILAFRERSCIWKWNVSISGEPDLDRIFRMGNGTRKSDRRLPVVHHDHWYSVWKTVL